MLRGKAFAVVGHRNWGKSKTLQALAGGNQHQRTLVIKSREFFVRHMSNDDVPQGFYSRLKTLEPERWPGVIVALCPTFADKARRAELTRALQALRKRYQLFFFVLRTDCRRRKRQISDTEIDALSRFGKVKVFSDSTADPQTRARALERFIEKVL